MKQCILQGSLHRKKELNSFLKLHQTGQTHQGPPSPSMYKLSDCWETHRQAEMHAIRFRYLSCLRFSNPSCCLLAVQWVPGFQVVWAIAHAGVSFFLVIWFIWVISVRVSAPSPALLINSIKLFGSPSWSLVVSLFWVYGSLLGVSRLFPPMYLQEYHHSTVCQEVKGGCNGRWSHWCCAFKESNVSCGFLLVLKEKLF